MSCLYTITVVAHFDTVDFDERADQGAVVWKRIATGAAFVLTIQYYKTTGIQLF